MMEEDIKKLVEIAEKSLKIQEELLDYTKSMQKVIREMNVRVIDKLQNI